MNVKLGKFRVAHPAAAHVRLVGQDEGRRNGVDRHAGALVVIADGRHDGGDVLRLRPHVLEDAKGHHGAALRVVHPVDEVADVVQIACNLAQLHLPLRIAQRLQQVFHRLGHMRHMRKAVLGKAQCHERLIGKGDIRSYFFTVFYF